MGKMKDKVVKIIFLMIALSVTTTYYNSIIRADSITNTNSNTYYVSKTGDDNNAGTLSAPWKTIQKAANIVNPGDTVYVRGGTYTELVEISHSGTSNAWITFKNYQDELPIIDGTGKTPSYWAGGLIQISDASYIMIDGFKVQDSSESGICVLRSTYVTVQNCQTTNTGFSGIRVDYGEGIANSKYCTNVKILHNTISLANTYGNQEALTFSGVSNSEIKYNTLTSTCKKEGICLKHDCINVTVAYNNIDTPGVNIYVGSAPDDRGSYYIVYGNLCHGSGNGLGISLEKCGTANNFYFYNNIIECRSTGFLFNYENPISTCNKGPYNINFINNVFNVGGTCLRLNPPVAGDYGRNVTIKNNIFKGSNGITINSNQPENEVTIEHNFFACNSDIYGTDYITGDPKWVNPSNGDYNLQPTSPAIGFGIGITNLSIDFDINLIPKSTTTDSGTVEYNSNTSVDASEFKNISPSKNPSTTRTTENSKESKNNPLIKPTIKGRNRGIIDMEYEYKFVSTDPEGDNLKYCIDWGDGTNEVWIGPIESGQEVSSIHEWSEIGNYTIKVKVMDANGTVSELTTFKVNILYYLKQRLLIFNKVLNRFPYFENILNICLLSLKEY